MPRVSVIIPARDAAGCIGETLDSVTRQTFTDWELIVVDDGSTDATAELARSFDSRVTVIRNPRSEGPAAARNLAIANSTGELLALLDADDQWLPTYLECQVRLFDEQQARCRNVGIVACDALVLQDGVLLDQPYSAFVGPVVDITLERLLRSNPIFVSVLLPRELWSQAGGFAYEAFGVEDHDLWIRIVELGYRVVTNTAPLAVYRKHSAGISDNRARMARESELLYQRALARGRLNRHQQQIARRSRRLQRSVGHVEEFLAYPNAWAAPPSSWIRAADGAARLVLYALTTPRQWPEWGAALRKGRSSLWRAGWEG